MASVRENLARVMLEREGEQLADAFAEVIERRIEFQGTGDDYFASLLRLPSPLLELYAALIFDSRVRADGLADTVPLYDTPEFMGALRRGFEMLDQASLYTVIDRARKQLRDPASAALMSGAPNVALDREAGNVHSAYFAGNKQLMPRIGEYLRRERDLVLAAASELDGLA